VDVVISNCVINLSTDKGKTLREAFRVLKPGGRFAVSDVVVLGKLPEATRKDTEAYVGCVAGALERDEYEALLRDAGFTDIEFQVTREYSFEGACCGGGSGCGKRRRQRRQRVREGDQARVTVLFVCVHNAARSQMAETSFGNSPPAALSLFLQGARAPAR